ncbi:hypothetical protein R3F64_07815 [Halomonas sp. 5021]|jgi:hypothetical protein|uniref:hypothetical protein n=1 Tax=Halomonas sp. 5021 TaxID=3082156 RepID=UPI002FC8F102
MSDNKRQTLLDSLTKGFAYAVPVLALVAGGSAVHAVYSDVTTESGYYMMAAAEGGAEAEGEAEAEGGAEAEAAS